MPPTTWLKPPSTYMISALTPAARSAHAPGVAARLSTLDRFLPLWIFAAMAAGVGLGRLFPGLGALLDRVQVAGVSVPIGIGLLWMMYPVLAKVRYEDMGRVTGDRRMLWLSLLLNWVIGSALMSIR